VSDVRKDSGESALKNATRLGAFGHKAECACRICAMIQAARAAGKRPAEKKEPKKRQKPGPRQKAYANAIALQALSGQRPNQTFAAIAAGCDPKTADVDGAALARNPTVRSLVSEALAKVGITRGTLADVMKRGLNAYETKLATKDGKFSDSREIPDFHAMFKYLDASHRLLGDYPKDELIERAALILKVPMGSSPDDMEKYLDAYFVGQTSTMTDTKKAALSADGSKEKE
jgi:hypothetical protein